MALYLGNSGKLKVNLNNAVCHLNLFSKKPITNGIRLLSSDEYILQDMNGLYLTALSDAEITAELDVAILDRMRLGG